MASAMRGEVNSSLEPTLELTLVGEEGLLLHTPAVIDTGFDHALLVPSSVAAILGWPAQATARVFLADGRSRRVPIHLGELEWLGERQQLEVVVAGDGVLVGMKLLLGTSLSMDVVEGGPLTIERLLPAQ